MNPQTLEPCREHLEDIWSAWPKPEEVPPRTAAHAAGCSDCGRELLRLHSLCARSSDWGAVLRESYWLRLSALTRRSLDGFAASPWLWAPALTLSAGLLLTVARRPAPPRQPMDVPIEAVEQREFLQHLDMMERWAEVETPASPHGGAR